MVKEGSDCPVRTIRRKLLQHTWPQEWVLIAILKLSQVLEIFVRATGYPWRIRRWVESGSRNGMGKI